jgi:hypothetical protein
VQINCDADGLRKNVADSWVIFPACTANKQILLCICDDPCNVLNILIKYM